MDDLCEKMEGVRPDVLWCVDEVNAWQVGAQRDCSNSSVSYCRRRECVQSDECANAILQLLIATEELRNENTRRLCSCLGSSYSVTTDLQGFLECVYTADLTPPLSRSFYKDTNTIRYTHATCDQLSRCTPVKAYDSAKFWIAARNITSCASYTTCTQNKRIASMAECLYNDPYTIIDSQGQVCSEAQKHSICEPETKAIYCNNCAAYGAIAERPGEDPPASICAYPQKCVAKDIVADPYASQRCEQVVNNERGEWCPTLSEAINSYPPAVLPPQSYTTSELCSQCESANPSSLCCAHSNTFKVVTSESECKSVNESFCPTVPCTTSTACQFAFAQSNQAYIDKSYLAVKELCECLGEDFKIQKNRNGLYSCKSKLTDMIWNSNVQNISTMERRFEAVTCKQLARCEPKNALNNALYIESLPDECQETKTCDAARAKGEALACATETIYDMNNEKCSAQDAGRYCDAELTAIQCLACANGTGLNSSLKVCASEASCTEVGTRAECTTGYCPDILGNISLSYHEMCRSCEVGNPGKLCCANSDANAARTVTSGDECRNEHDMLCADVSCVVSEPCPASSDDKILLELCNCLGINFAITAHPLTGSPYCKRVSKDDDTTDHDEHEAWDAWEAVGAEVRFKYLHCAGLETCLPNYLHDVVAHYKSLPATCAHEKKCFDDRAAQREMLCTPFDRYRDASLAMCTDEEGLRYCKGVSGVEACMQCPGGMESEEAVCASGAACTPNTTLAQCGGMWCPAFLKGAQPPVELGPPAKNSVVHVPIPPPPPPPSATVWWVALAFSVALCTAGVVGVHLLQNSQAQSSRTRSSSTALDYNNPSWHDFS
eukprot:TRINITY_DN13718_c0_g1_i1.p1 TRINITY_DN13718_c0_g1~~TRINITY_DN13718_c0_g1_i1.p1  ORF type:complete len:861 (+),score=172.07 TRINITY_DN13718_c0_g1_i1:71-2584(+)